MAFATSFAPCAKLRSAAENMSGMVKSLFTESFVFSKLWALALSLALTTKKIISATKNPSEAATKNDGLGTTSNAMKGSRLSVSSMSGQIFLSL